MALYYIDAIESEISLFDFPGISPANESYSEGFGNKIVKVIKFIVRKIRDFVKKILSLIKYLLGHHGQYKALDIKDKALKDLQTRIKQYLPDKDVTDLTKVKGLSSYQGGESGPFITDAQSQNAIRAVDTALDFVIKKYTDELKIYKSDISTIQSTTLFGSIKMGKMMIDLERDINKKQDWNTALADTRNGVIILHEYSEKSKSSRDSILKTANDSKTAIINRVTEIINGATNDLPSELSNVIKSITDKYATMIRIALREGEKSLNKDIKSLEESAHELEDISNMFEGLADQMSNVGETDEISGKSWRQSLTNMSKTALEYSQVIFASTNMVKTSSEYKIFTNIS